MSADDTAAIDEPDEPDAQTLLMVYMLRDGYSGDEVESYMAQHFPAATTVTEWGHPDHNGVRYSLSDWEKFRTSYPQREHLTAHVRQHTRYASHVTDWAPVDGEATK